MSDITIEFSLTQDGNKVTERATVANPATVVSFLLRAVQEMASVLTEEEAAVEPTANDILSCIRTFEGADGFVDEVVVV